MSSKDRVYNAPVARRALVVFASIILTLIGSLAVIQYNRDSREEVAAASKNKYLYDVSIVSPSHGEEILVEDGIDLLVTVKGREGVQDLPRPEEVTFFNRNDFLGSAQEKVEVESEVCQQENQKCVIGNYLLNWNQESEVYPLVEGDYADLHVIIKGQDGPTVGASQSVYLKVSLPTAEAQLESEEVSTED